MQSRVRIEDLHPAHRSQTWSVGQKGTKQRRGSFSFSWTTTRCSSSRVTAWKGLCPDSPAFDITRDAVAPAFRANDFEGGIASGNRSRCLKQFAGNTRELEKRCGRAGAVRITLPGSSFSFSFWSYFFSRCAPRVVSAVIVIPALAAPSFRGIGVAVAADGRRVAAGLAGSVAAAEVRVAAAARAAVGKRCARKIFLAGSITIE